MNIDPLQPRNDTSLFLLLFVLLYLPGLAFLPLTTPEAMAALGRIDTGTINALRHPFLSGETLAVYPFYKTAVVFFKFFLGANEWAARMPSIISLLGMCGLSAWMGRRYGGRDGAIAAAVTCACAFASLSAGRQASGHAITAVLLNAAWLSWFVLGRDNRRWGLAWSVALTIVLIASFHAGIKAFVIFYFPLFFLRRPIKIWRRVGMAQHLGMLFFAFALYLLFQASMDGTPITVEALGRWYTYDGGPINLGDMLLYPVLWLLFLLPSTLFFWPGFCAAFRPLERNRQCASFMRTIVTTLSLGLWIIPNTSARDLVIIMVPLAVLAGIHYEYLERRYSHVLNRILRLLFIGVFAVSVVALFLILAVLLRIVELDAVPVPSQIFASIMIVVAALAADLTMRSSQSQPVWLRIMILMVVAQNLFVGMTFPVREVFASEARDRGMAMRAELPADVTVYRLSSLALLPEIFYMNHPVVELTDVQDLPKDQSTVHVLAGYDPPLTESRVWSPLGPEFSTNSFYTPVIEWFVDRSTLVRLSRRIESPALPAPSRIIRLYRGVRPETRPPSPEQGEAPASSSQ